MRLIKEISFNEVILEWLRAEWYGFSEEIRNQHQYLIDSHANLTNNSDNQLRTKHLWSRRSGMLHGLVTLPFKWYLYEMSSEDKFENLSIVPSSDWYLITNKSFALKHIKDHIHLHEGHNKKVTEIKDTLSDSRPMKGRLITVGSDPETLTIIEGNHRASALYIDGKEKGYDFLPLQVIVGLSPIIRSYPWSVERGDMDNHLKICEQESV